MQKSVAAFRGSLNAELYIVNDNEPWNQNSGILSRVVTGAIALQQFPCDIKVNGVIVLARHVRGARMACARPPDEHLFVHNKYCEAI